ncbi:MAG: pyridoxal phosphate-dependent aminotransferase family protein, partial [Thermoproteota archaeon]
MNHKLDFVNSSLKKIRDRNLYRKLQYGRIEGAYIVFDRKKLINLCSNDYLGLDMNLISSKQLQSSSRLVAGNDSLFKILEEKLARHKSQESSLIFP